MNSDDNQREEQFRRIRRLKRILRPLPRRATVHRYPVLKWFADTARKRSYLWSFRREHVIPALYAGCIGAMLMVPLQTLIAFALVLLVRGNLMIAAALTLITNPFTFVPLYASANWVGNIALHLFWTPPLDQEITQEVIEMMAENADAHPVMAVAQWYAATILGGVLLGIAMGFILNVAYEIISRRYRNHSFHLLERYSKKYLLLREKSATPADSEHTDTENNATEGNEAKGTEAETNTTAQADDAPAPIHAPVHAPATDASAASAAPATDGNKPQQTPPSQPKPGPQFPPEENRL